jgi:hypothetical protein
MRLFALLLVLFLSFGLFAQDEVVGTEVIVSKDGILKFIVDGQFSEENMYQGVGSRYWKWLYGIEKDGRYLLSTSNPKRHGGFKYLLDTYAQGVRLVEEADGDKVQEDLGYLMCLISYYHMATMKVEASMIAAPARPTIIAAKAYAHSKTVDYFEVAGFSDAQKAVAEKMKSQFFHPVSQKEMIPTYKKAPKIQKPYEKFFAEFKAASAN